MGGQASSVDGSHGPFVSTVLNADLEHGCALVCTRQSREEERGLRAADGIGVIEGPLRGSLAGQIKRHQFGSACLLSTCEAEGGETETGGLSMFYLRQYDGMPQSKMVRCGHSTVLLLSAVACHRCMRARLQQAREL